MLGWLRKKRRGDPGPAGVAGPAPDEPAAGSHDARATPGSDSPQLAALVQRWDATIAGVTARLDGILAEAAAASDGLIAGIQGTDMGPLSRLWSATEAKLHQHTEEISDGWDTISDEISELDDLPDEVMDREGDKRDAANCELEIHYQRAYRGAMARAAEHILALARQSGDPDAMRMCTGSGVALYIGQREGQEAWEAMVRAETRINAYRERRDVPMDLLEGYEASARRYWTTTLTVEAQHAPQLQQYVEQKIDRYMKDVNKTLRQHWQWRERQA